MKCDTLLGKNIKVVLTTLGPPTETIESPKSAGIYSLVWKYEDSTPNGPIALAHSVELTFNSDRNLTGVNYDGFVNGSHFTDLPDGNPNSVNYKSSDVLAQILKICNPTTLKVGYGEYSAQQVAPKAPSTIIRNYSVTLKSKTNGYNFFGTTCQVMAPNPLIVTRQFDTSAGIYKNTFSPNPDFKLNYTATFEFHPGVLSLAWSHPKTSKHHVPSSDELYNQPDTHYQLVTTAIMPWLQENTLKL